MGAHGFAEMYVQRLLLLKSQESLEQRRCSPLPLPHETLGLTYSQEGKGVLDGHTLGLICRPEEWSKDGERSALEKHSAQKHCCALGR